MEKINVEFDCQMKTADDLKKVEQTLKKIGDLDNININLENKSVTFDLNQNTTKGLQEIQKQVEKDTGLLTVLKGFGNTLSVISEVHSDYCNVKRSDYSVEERKPVIGVIRLTQLFNNQCFVDGVIDNLSEKSNPPFSVNINEYGDLSGENLEKVGESKIKIIDNLSATSKTTRFNKVISNCDLNDCIGRSVVIRNSRRNLAAGIVARSSPVTKNTKRICVCSGKSIWEERKDTKEGSSN